MLASGISVHLTLHFTYNFQLSWSCFAELRQYCEIVMSISKISVNIISLVLVDGFEFKSKNMYSQCMLQTNNRFAPVKRTATSLTSGRHGLSILKVVTRRYCVARNKGCKCISNIPDHYLKKSLSGFVKFT